MWWRNLLALLILLPGLAACGFRPLYGKLSQDPEMAKEMALIQVGPISERSGQLLRNALLRRVNPGGDPLKPEYSLTINLIKSEAQQALRKDDTATRNQITYSITYRLNSKSGLLAAGTMSRQVSYDYLQQHYANISADEDVERTAVEELAEEVRNQVAAYFVRAAAARAKANQQQGH